MHAWFTITWKIIKKIYILVNFLCVCGLSTRLTFYVLQTYVKTFQSGCTNSTKVILIYTTQHILELQVLHAFLIMIFFFFFFFFFFFSLWYILFTLFSQSIFHRSREGEGSQPPIGSFVFGITHIDKTVGKTTWVYQVFSIFITANFLIIWFTLDTSNMLDFALCTLLVVQLLPLWSNFKNICTTFPDTFTYIFIYLYHSEHSEISLLGLNIMILLSCYCITV